MISGLVKLYEENANTLTLTHCIPPFITVTHLRYSYSAFRIQSIMADLLEGLVIAHLGQGIAVEHDNQIILCQTLRRVEPSPLAIRYYGHYPHRPGPH